MAIFAVIRQPSPTPENLSAAIKEAFPENFYDLGSGVWLIAATSTAKGVSDTIGVTDGSKGSAVVVEAASYFGRANPAIWSWIRAKWEGSANG